MQKVKLSIMVSDMILFGKCTKEDSIKMFVENYIKAMQTKLDESYFGKIDKVECDIEEVNIDD